MSSAPGEGPAPAEDGHARAEDGHAQAEDVAQQSRAYGVSMSDAFRVWGYVALNSFGGPAGQIAVMHRVLVDGRRWISERRFLHALNYCMLLPGPEAHQLAVYIGWLLHGIRGGLMAGLLFILPGFLSILALSVLYAGYQETSLVAAFFYGIKPAVLAIVAAAVVRVGHRALPNRTLVAIAISAFVATFFLDIPFPLIILAAAAIGFFGSRLAPLTFGGGLHPGPADGDEPADPAARHLLRDDIKGGSRPSLRRAAAILAVGMVVWVGPVVAVAVLFGGQSIFVQQGLFFSGAALVTFGGAYAVLAYIAQEVVERLAWLTPEEMLDGLGMAETTPGPLIMVVQFVGFLAAFRSPGDLDPMLAGLIGAILVTWVTFVPATLWIFLGAPYIEYLREKRALTGALSAITATVVGVIANLGLWFSLHTLFGVVDQVRAGPLRLYVPDPATLDLAALAIAIFALVAIFRLRWPILATIAVSAVVGTVYHLAFLS